MYHYNSCFSFKMYMTFTKQETFWQFCITHCTTSSISCTKSYNLNVSRLILELSLSNPLEPGVKSAMKMYLNDQRLLPTIVPLILDILWHSHNSGLIVGLHPADKKRRYKVIASLIGSVQTYNQPCNYLFLLPRTLLIVTILYNRNKLTKSFYQHTDADTK